MTTEACADQPSSNARMADMRAIPCTRFKTPPYTLPTSEKSIRRRDMFMHKRDTHVGSRDPPCFACKGHLLVTFGTWREGGGPRNHRKARLGPKILYLATLRPWLAPTGRSVQRPLKRSGPSWLINPALGFRFESHPCVAGGSERMVPRRRWRCAGGGQVPSRQRSESRRVRVSIVDFTNSPPGTPTESASTE